MHTFTMMTRLALLLSAAAVFAQNPAPVPLSTATINSNGIFPALTVTAASAPNRSECGVGALMPWADRLWMISYLSVPNAGSGTGA